MKPPGIIVAVVLASAAAAGMALAEDPAAVAHARHEHFKEIGASMKGVSDELKSSAPSVVKIQSYAKRIDELAPQLPTWFPAGSGPGPGVKTHAKPVVWTKPEEFQKDARAFAAEANKFNAVALQGNLAAIGTEASALGQTCKTCHQTFRERED